MMKDNKFIFNIDVKLYSKWLKLLARYIGIQKFYSSGNEEI